MQKSVNNHEITNLFCLTFKLYIGSGTLQGNTTYTVNILGLRDRESTEAFINGEPAVVNYLVNIDSVLFLSQLQGNVYVGGFPQSAQIKVNIFLLIAIAYSYQFTQVVDSVLTKPHS